MGQHEPTVDQQEAFTRFVKLVEPGLRAALVARYGPERGRDAAAEALAWAWENWEKVEVMKNASGYLYRVGQSNSRRTWPIRPVFAPQAADQLPWVEPGLPEALASLSARQREAVVLVYGYGYTHEEAARMLGLARSSVQNHVERGIAKLRVALGGIAR